MRHLLSLMRHVSVQDLLAIRHLFDHSHVLGRLSRLSLNLWHLLRMALELLWLALELLRLALKLLRLTLELLRLALELLRLALELLGLLGRRGWRGRMTPTLLVLTRIDTRGSPLLTTDHQAKAQKYHSTDTHLFSQLHFHRLSHKVEKNLKNQSK